MNTSAFTLFGHGSALAPVHWQFGPNTRGTWDIISGCVVTLSLCLWTSLHLNIPEHHGATAQRWRKVGWLLIGLLAPEMVVYTALEQRRAALQLTKEMQAQFGDKPESKWPKLFQFFRPTRSPQVADDASFAERETGPSARRHRWKHVHSFYALMGGFVFDTSSAPLKFLPNDRSRLTLRLGGLQYIAEHEPSLIPDLSEDEIRDKSKADSLAKLLICLQAIWFCVQCILRVAQNQEISFLELNTFAHAICTLLIYVLWWHKPLDIESPTLLVGKEACEICALMCVTSNGERFWNTKVSQLLFWRNFSDYYNNRRETELSRGQKYGDRVISRAAEVFNGRHLARLRQHQTQPRAVLRWDPVPDNTNKEDLATPQEIEPRSHPESGRAVRIRKGDSLFGFRCMDVYTQADWSHAFPAQKDRDRGLGYKNKMKRERRYQARLLARDIQTHKSTKLSDKDCVFETPDFHRWGLVSRAWQKYQPTFQEYDPSNTTLERRLYNGVGDRARNWPEIHFRLVVAFVPLCVRLLTVSIATGLYGGLHLLAWNAFFASVCEQFFWRASSTLLAASGPALLLIHLSVISSFLFRRMAHESSNEWTRCLSEVLEEIGSFIGMFLSVPVMGLFGTCYVPARVFLLIECCLQLARLPPGAYTTPDWSKYFPHIN